ncbi:uncharacterized protein [Manis javanica]|uniref:uncharacterized protein n=1 Tax=Manis javanica TaxID=9974 RepID=UPI003C6D95AF
MCTIEQKVQEGGKRTAISPNEQGQGSGAWEVRRGRIGPERSRLLGPITGAGPGCRPQGARFREARWKPRHCLAGEFQAPLWAPVWTAHRWTSPVSLSPTCPQQQALHPRQDGFLTCQEKSPSLQALFHLPRLHCVLLSYSSISPKLAGRGGWCPEPGVQLRAGSATALRDQSERSVRERCTSGETLAPGGSQLGREHRGVGPRGWEVGPGSPPHTARTPRTGCGFPAGCAQSLFPARLPRVRCTSGKESKCTIRGTPGARSQQGPAAASSCGWWASTGRWTSVEDLALKEHWISQIPLKGRKISQSIPVGSDRPGWSVSTTSQACVPADFQPTDSKGDGGDRRGPGLLTFRTDTLGR